MKFLVLFLIFCFPFLVTAQEHCHRLEGVRLPHCTPQATEVACVPEPVPCPPRYAFKACSTMMITDMGGGVCDAYGLPECHQEGDKTVCGPAPCVHYTDAYCKSIPIKCGIEQVAVPSTGTMSCAENTCVYGPIPAGLTDCGGYVPLCQGNQTCPL